VDDQTVIGRPTELTWLTEPMRKADSQPSRAQAVGRRLATNRSSGMAVALVALCLFGWISSSKFFTTGNGLNIAQQVALIGIMAVGMTFVIVAGDIDLSVGSTYALASVVSADLLENGQSAAVAVAAGLLVGCAAGTVNGIATVVFAIPSFIVTLGTLSVFRGISLLMTDGNPISLNQSDPNVSQFSVLGTGKVAGGVSVQTCIFVAVAIVGGLLLSRSRFGYHVYAVGGSATAARLCGINVNLVRILNFAISGTLAALAGIIGLAFLLYVQGVTGTGLELTVITAVIVGGTALFGGSGTVIGTVIGVLIIGVLNNVLVLRGVPSFWQTTVIGLVIISAVAFDALVRRRAN
jgi:ribose transport system permease protein